MTRTRLLRSVLMAASAASMFGVFGLVNAAEPDPKVMKVTLPANIKWSTSASGNSTAVLYGDPDQARTVHRSHQVVARPHEPSAFPPQ